jgi:hypothetical protein
MQQSCILIPTGEQDSPYFSHTLECVCSWQIQSAEGFNNYIENEIQFHFQYWPAIDPPFALIWSFPYAM